MLEKRDKTRIKEFIDNNSYVKATGYIFQYVFFFDLETIKFIFEYYEKINRKIDTLNIIIGLKTITRPNTTTIKVLEYLKYMKKHNYNESISKIKENPSLYFFYQIAFEYAITKRINICKDIKYFYIFNNNIELNKYCTRDVNGVKHNYIVYASNDSMNLDN